MKRKAMDATPYCDSGEPSPSSASAGPDSVFNTDVLEEIFLNLSPHQVVCLCRLVCRQWKEVADRESFWTERCRREGYQIRDASKQPKDWRLFYFLCRGRRNLLKNPRGEDGLNGWEILRNGGDRWVVENTRKPLPDETVKLNFVTSFGWCIKSQLIDLEKEGYSPSFMDYFQPDIRISEWYTARSDCGSKYKIHVELLNQKMEPIQRFAPEIIDVPGGHEVWKQMTHEFQNYGQGVRFIRFTHGGVDSRWWKGWYGVRLADCCVEIYPNC
ncbi:F-box only protein 44-like [Pholidichthys leucotaenia]